MINFEFNRRSRLRTAHDFDAVKKCGVRSRSGPLSVLAALGKEQRLGIIASRRTGGAVARNKIRRTVREFFRNNRELFPTGDCVIVFFEGASGLAAAEIRQHLCRALEKLKIRLGEK